MIAKHSITQSMRPVLTLIAVFALSGCATFSRDGGFSSVEKVTQERLGKEVKWARDDAGRATIEARVTELLKEPLSVDSAVQIALFNNKGLQASFQELGISEAVLVQAGRLPNPGFSFGRLRRGTEIEWERGLHINLARLFAMPLISQVEQRRFAQVQGEVTLSVLRLAAETAELEQSRFHFRDVIGAPGNSIVISLIASLFLDVSVPLNTAVDAQVPNDTPPPLLPGNDDPEKFLFCKKPAGAGGGSL